MRTTPKLLTTAAVIAITAGAAYAENHTGNAAMEENAEASQMERDGVFPMGWNEDLDQRYAGIADTPVRDLVGITVLSDAGEDIGEIDTFVIVEDRLQAVVGVGGFLGIGEHDVALPLDELTWDGQSIVVPYTAEELEAMPEWTEVADFATLAETDTFRTRGDMESMADQNSELAATQHADNPDAVEVDEETAEAEMEEGAAEVEETAANMADETENAAEEGAMEIEQTAENAADATENAAEEAGEEVADAAAETENAVEEGAMEVEQTAENAADATENAAEEAGEEVADAAAETENAVEEGAMEVEQTAENATEEAGEEVAEAAEATENAAEEAGEEVAEAAAETENAVEEGAAEAEQVAENAAATVGSWFEQIEAEFGELADAEITELEGKDVVGMNGEVIGEIEDIAMQGDTPVAVVGVGGFLGMGEHDVALELTRMSWNGEHFVVDGYNEEDLKAMPEVDLNNVEILDDDVTLRSRASM